ncbi:MAG: hypothetical protein LBL45_13620 [Treponema sp.]|jgi:alpha-D-xyloside xylohydrolase|nr:hypothetical protein [Treponema sp.]
MQTAEPQAGKPTKIPFSLTNKGYDVFVNNTGNVHFEAETEKTSRVQFSAAGESLEYLGMYGPSPKQILERCAALTDRTPLLESSTFGLWLSTSFTTPYDEATVMRFIDGVEERSVPLSVFHFDYFWMKGFHFSEKKDGSVYQTDMWISGMASRFHQSRSRQMARREVRRNP